MGEDGEGTELMNLRIDLRKEPGGRGIVWCARRTAVVGGFVLSFGISRLDQGKERRG